MRKNTTVLVLCGLLILAVAITFQYTFSTRAEMSWTFLSSAIFAESLTAMALAWLAIAVFRKSYWRQKKPLSRERFAFAGQLRRLFVSVSS
jgi:hypothetical protein